jgi:sulfur carrier protein
MPHITLNGETRTVSPATTLVDLLVELELAGKRLAVERNGEIVPRSQHASTVLSEGDALEIVVAVGGG